MRCMILLICIILRIGTSEGNLIHADWSFVLYDTVNVLVGDTIEFSWTGYHDIWIHPSLNCDDTTGSINVATAVYGGTAQYTFQSSDGAASGKEMFFACHVGDGIHCNYGVNQRVMVFSEAIPENLLLPPSSSPITKRPSNAPLVVTPAPTGSPTSVPVIPQTVTPTIAPIIPQTVPPTVLPIMAPTVAPTVAPIFVPTTAPAAAPSIVPTGAPTASPTIAPTAITESPSSFVVPVPPTLDIAAEANEARQGDSAPHLGGWMVGIAATLVTFLFRVV